MTTIRAVGWWIASIAIISVAGCASGTVDATAAGAVLVRLDETSRVAVTSSTPGDVELLRSRLSSIRDFEVSNALFTTGTLEGRAVVLFFSGVGMVNAAMNTQRAIDRFNLTHLVSAGTATGMSSEARPGDIVVPERWGQYHDIVVVRGPTSTVPNQQTQPPANDETWRPRPVDALSPASKRPVRVSWFQVDPRMFATARTIASARATALTRCAAGTRCLDIAPMISVGGDGVSGAPSVPTKLLREQVFGLSGPSALDSESAAVGHVAYSNGLPWIGVRALVDAPGGTEIDRHAARAVSTDNISKFLMRFLAAWK